MARYGVAWPFPQEEEIVSPKMIIFKAGPYNVRTERYLPFLMAIETTPLPTRMEKPGTQAGLIFALALFSVITSGTQSREESAFRLPLRTADEGSATSPISHPA